MVMDAAINIQNLLVAALGAIMEVANLIPIGGNDTDPSFIIQNALAEFVYTASEHYKGRMDISAGSISIRIIAAFAKYDQTKDPNVFVEELRSYWKGKRYKDKYFST